jgi:hypothetical protein
MCAKYGLPERIWCDHMAAVSYLIDSLEHPSNYIAGVLTCTEAGLADKYQSEKYDCQDEERAESWGFLAPRDPLRRIIRILPGLPLPSLVIV